MAVTVSLVSRLGISTVHWPAYRCPVVGLVAKSVASLASGETDTMLCDPSRCNTVAQRSSPCLVNRSQRLSDSPLRSWMPIQVHRSRSVQSQLPHWRSNQDAPVTPPVVPPRVRVPEGWTVGSG